MIKSINLNLDGLDNKYENGVLVIDRKTKAINVTQRLLTIFQSVQFRNAMLGLSRETWMSGEDASSSFINRSNEEIYNAITNGKEEWTFEVDYEMDMNIKSYYMNNYVVGYMIPFRPDIHVNTKFFDTNSEPKVASNLAHEWMHTLGSRHGGSSYRTSLPYYMNKVVEDLYYKRLTRFIPSSRVEDTTIKPIPEPKVPIEGRIEAKKVRVCRPWWKFWAGPRCVTKVVG